MKNCVQYTDRSETSDQIDDFYFDSKAPASEIGQLIYSKKRKEKMTDALMNLTKRDKGLS